MAVVRTGRDEFADIAATCLSVPSMPDPKAPAQVERAEATSPSVSPATWTARRVAADSAEWSSLLAAKRHLVFHEAAWASVTERGFESETYAIVLEKDGAVVGGMLGFAFRSLWAKLGFFSFPYGGVIGEAPDGVELSRLLRTIARESGLARVRLTEYPGLPAAAVAGAESTPMRTHILDFSGRDYDAIWSGYKARIRRDVRKAERSGVTVEEASSPADVEAFYNLYLDSMRRNHAIAKYSLALVEAIVERLGPRGRSAILLARREGEAIAGVLLVDSANVSHYLMGGSTSAGLQYCPNDLLLHTAIRRAVDRGLGAFDFLPSGEDDTALESFKAKWGATARGLTVHTTVIRPWVMKTWDLAYEIASSRVGSSVLRFLRGK